MGHAYPHRQFPDCQLAGLVPKPNKQVLQTQTPMTPICLSFSWSPLSTHTLIQIDAFGEQPRKERTGSVKVGAEQCAAMEPFSVEAAWSPLPAALFRKHAEGPSELSYFLSRKTTEL